MMERVVSVVFQGNYYEKEYSYKTDLDLKAGDKVVVDTPNNGLQIVTVTKVRGLTASQLSKASKWVIQCIDMAAYEERMRKAEIAQEIRNKLRQRKDAVEEALIYQRLAKDDPEINKLLQELSEVDSSFHSKLLEESIEK